MKSLSSLGWLGLALFISITTVNPVMAQNSAAVVRLQPSVLDVGEGQIETLTLVLENAHEVYGIDVRASFDPAVIEIVDADPASEGVQLTPGSFPQPDFLVRNIADNETGSLMYVATQVNPTPPVSGQGLVVSIQIRGKASGQQSGLTIDFVELVDREGRILDVQSQNGLIQVEQPKLPTPTLSSPASVTGLGLSTAQAEPIPTSSVTVLPTEGAELSLQNSSIGSTGWLIILGGGFLVGVLVLLVVAGWVALKPSKPRLTGKRRLR